jgi:integrase
MKPYLHKTGRWAVQWPISFDPEKKKRRTSYFDTRTAAEKAIKETLTERKEHGRASVTAEERAMIVYAREALGSLDRLPAVIESWRRSADIVKITFADAVDDYTTALKRETVNPRTIQNTRTTLKPILGAFGSRLVSEVSDGELEAFLGDLQGWTRYTQRKHLASFYTFAVRKRYVARSPLAELPKNRMPTPSREIYTPEEFHTLLDAAEIHSHDVVFPFIILMGFCYLRRSELVKQYANDKVLEWSDLKFDRKMIHVRSEVAKATKRESDERFIEPLSPIALAWLWHLQRFDEEPRTGACVPMGFAGFSKEWLKVIRFAGVRNLRNGLRHSCLSYSMAYYQHGIALTAEWAGNSPSAIRKHYRRAMSKADGEKWFNTHPAFGWPGSELERDTSVPGLARDKIA